MLSSICLLFFFKQKTAYEMRISDWSSDVCSSDLVGAFSDKADADDVVERLKTAGFIGFSEPVKTAGGTLYRVRVGPEITRAEAEKLRTNVADKLKLDGIVVSHP